MLSSNNFTLNLNKYESVRRLKVTKFLFVPDNVNTNLILLNINGLNGHAYISNSGIASYLFMVPFINNNNSPSYTNDLNDKWDYVNLNGCLLNKLDIKLTDETGQLLAINGSRIIVELLIE